ncbi:hypothetical protein B0H11DRAFT_1732868, partial [Mycena galericulata]
PKDVHVMTSFFWPKLETGYINARLAKWTKTVDIFTKDAVLIPINIDNAHWAVVAIQFRQKQIVLYDSARWDLSYVFPRLREYLDCEHRDKRKTPFDFTDWQNNTPRQTNGYDCGVFACQFIRYLARAARSFPFDQNDILALRKRMALQINDLRLLS